ncbi:hypothetical protein X946_4469 [Burkholderia sp. ABCPW 111]|nr:hypothetical protein X946_4469 [Burkholderia sp. ABCPW 111]
MALHLHNASQSTFLSFGERPSVAPTTVVCPSPLPEPPTAEPPEYPPLMLLPRPQFEPSPVD